MCVCVCVCVYVYIFLLVAYLSIALPPIPCMHVQRIISYDLALRAF